MAKSKAPAKKGLTVKTFQGLSKKRMEKKSGGENSGKRVVLKDSTTIPVQFYTDPEGFLEFEIHQFQDDGRWNNVPCLGDGCPLCEDESEQKSKTKYRFAAQVYNLAEKKAQILEGPKDLAGKIFFRYQQKPATFLKRTFEINRFPTNPVSYGCDKGDDDPIKISGIKPIDLMEYVTAEAKQYYGDELPTATSLDADDDDIEAEDDDADEWDREELEGKTVKALQKIAADEGASKADIKEAGKDKDALIDLILGEDDDEDDDLDDDDEDDDDLDDDDDDDLDEDDDDDDDEDDEDDDDDSDDEDEDDDEDDDDDEDEDDEPAPPKKSAKKAPAKAAKKRK